MKNIITSLALIALLIGLTACGGSDTTTTTTGTATPTDDTSSGSDDEPDVPPVNLGDPDANVGLGYGTGTEFQNGEALAALTDLTAGGSTSVTVNLVDLDNAFEIYLGQRTVTFNSYCAQLGLAEFNPSTVEASGLAISNYQDKGCGREDNIFVSIVDRVGVTDAGEDILEVTATANATVDVKLPIVGVIKFISAEPSAIALKGVGSDLLPEMSTLSFQVLDRSGNPMFAKTVTYELDHIIGDVSLSRDEAVTNIDGIATIQLLSGRVNGTVRVSATVDVNDEDGNITGEMGTQSNPIGMITGLPDQNSFSLGADILNPQGWDVIGTPVTISAYLADHYQNPVPDGTIVAFAAEGGRVGGTCATTSGACSVIWVSQDPKPVDGIVTIIARTVGEGDYQDGNSNGLYDPGELFDPYPEVFIDANGNGIFDKDAVYNSLVDIDETGDVEFGWDAATTNFFEEFFDFDNDGVRDETSDKYQGVTCSTAAFAAGHCDKLMDVSRSIELIMSEGRNPLIEGPWLYNPTTGRYDTEVSCIDVSVDRRQIMWRLADSLERRNKLANGSKVSFTLDGWLDAVSGANFETIGNYSAPLRYDLWKDTQTSTDAAQLKYDYLNYRGHTYVVDLAYDNDYSGIFSDIGILGLDLTSAGRSFDSGLQVSAIGRTYEKVMDALGGVVTSIDVSGGATVNYTVNVVTACGDGLETGAVISVETANGTLSNWSSDDNISQESTAGATFSVSEDRRSAGNSISFDITTDGVTSLDDITITVRDGQLRQKTAYALISVQD
ncbi:MAG: hypothetical protein V7785_02545 [Bermanella sp.]